MNLKGTKVGVVGGGISLEREISLISSQQVCKALRRKKIEAAFIDLRTAQPEEVKQELASYNIDVAFITMHGEFGEDGRLQEILEEMNMPYTGSSPSASYLAMNKIAAKKVFLKAGIPTPPFWRMNKDNFLPRHQSRTRNGWGRCAISPQGTTLNKKQNTLEELPESINYPLVVKPFSSGSSIGVFIVKNKDELREALRKAFSLQDEAVVESYIEGRELTAGILEDRPLSVIEIISPREYFDFQAKYAQGEAELKMPADLGDDICRQVKEASLKAHRALGCRHFSRVDIRLSKDNIPYVLEVNSIPGLTAHSLLPLSAKGSGIDFDELIERMASLALNPKFALGN